ncbi:MAG TPA: M48 family metalloprotease [Sphingomicrobium sp.]|nr:M48 family metalloprotease [Sphingomicrobium sp.]
MRRAVLLISAAVLVAGPVAAQYPRAPISQGRQLDPRDVAEAQREHAAMVQELGGAETGTRAAYVDQVGHRVASFSGVSNPGQAIRFTTINSAVENAFSIPGGNVYVTRQLMTLMDDESELAFALGHEVAHIAANHAHIREAYARRNSVFGVLGQVLGAWIGNNVFGQMISQSAQRSSQLRTLSFSRDQEYQADQLGMRYMIQAGYDPSGGPEMLAALSRNTALQARIQGRTNRQTPEWASTHPLSENRRQRALQNARETGALGRGLKNRDGFLNRLEGTFVDDDPAQGVIDGATFTHPDLRIQFRVPQGYLMSNGTSAVTISGSAGKAQFGGGRFNGPLDQYVMRVYQELAGGKIQLQVPPPRHMRVNGMDVAVTSARVNTRSGVLDASVVAYQWDPQRVYHFVMLTQGGYGIGPFASMVDSLRKITPAEAAAIRPRVIHVVTVRPGDTVQSLARQMAYRDFQVERFASLNGLAANSPLSPGRKVKLIVYGDRRA